MAPLFNLPSRSNKAGDSNIIKKTKSTKKSSGVKVKGGDGLLERISTIVAMVNRTLGKYVDKYSIITDERDLVDYIDSCIKNGDIAIDTETTGLEPITDKIAGVCLYTPGQKGTYIPLNHVSYITGAKIENQISEEFMAKQLQRLNEAKTKIIMFNAKFDTRFIRNQLGIHLVAYWDGFIGARLLNENEQENNLKYLHNKYCLGGKGDAFTFDDLFRGIPFTMIPIKTAYLYAARDPEITYELYKFQEPYLTIGTEECSSQSLEGVSELFHTIEMPLIPVIAKMEDTGVAFDRDVNNKLSVEYNAKLEVSKKNFEEACKAIDDEVNRYRLTKGSSCKLGNPINVASPDQIAILLYDILKLESVDKKKPRGTGEDILQQLKHPIVESILEYRGISKLLSTFIDKLPNNLNPKTGRIHASFNQIGADTGRFSSSNPNLQNIPSHNNEIRKMFRASDNYYMVSSDYSAQEPRITAHMSGDKKMIQAYVDGQDLYVTIASLAYDLPYDECKEFREDGTQNPTGKERRQSAKAIVLGVCYGKGVPAIATDLGIPVKKAQQIYDKIMVLFPGLKNFMEESERMAIELGYVTTVWGRKRRLPNMQLEPYEFSYVAGGKVSNNFDPLDFTDEEPEDDEVDEQTIRKYTVMLDRARSYKQKVDIKAKAKSEGIMIKDNGGYIAEATRQCVNARIQGSASDQTKKAMVLIGNNQRLNELGFRLLIPVHDELIGECPKENIKEVCEIFPKLMVEAAKDLAVPSKCDVEITKCWYGETIKI